MDKRWEMILTELGIEQAKQDRFADLSIDKAEYIENKDLMVVHLQGTSLLDIAAFAELEAKRDAYPDKIRLLFSYDKGLYNLATIKDYAHYFVRQHSNAQQANLLKEVTLSFDDNTLTVEVWNQGMAMILNELQKKIEHLMHLAGFNIQVAVVVNEQHDLNDKLKEMTTSADSKVKVPVKKVAKETKPRSSKKANLNSKELVKLRETNQEYSRAVVEGYVFADDIIITKMKKGIQTLKITDFEDSLLVKRFEGRGVTMDQLKSVTTGMWVRVYGNIRYDEFSKEYVMFPLDIVEIDAKEKQLEDLADQKRVELHLHTNMSTMDGITSIKNYVKLAKKLNHPAIAITDHNNVQAFPDAQAAGLAHDVKIIYGMETNTIDDETKIVINESDEKLSDATYVYFDLETTGLNNQIDEIIEIGAVKVKNGMEIDHFQSFVKANQKIPLFVRELTNISDHDLIKAPDNKEALTKFKDFYQDSILVAHNASFDIGFLNHNLQKLGYGQVTNPIIDTLQLSRALDKKSRAHNLGSVARRYNVKYNPEVAHRADYDAQILSHVYEGMKHQLLERHHITNINKINDLCDESFLIRQRPYHTTMLVKNKEGLKDLFKLVSLAHTKYFYGEPNLFKKHLAAYRINMLIGSACVNGEIYQNARSLSREELVERMKFYDYIEVFANTNLSHLVDLGDYKSYQEIEKTTKYIIECAREAGVMVVATGDVHYALEREKVFRDVYISALGIGGKLHPLFDRKQRIKNMPDQYYKTTDQMLKDFSYLGQDVAQEIVITNTQKINDMIEQVMPIKDKLYAPKIEGVDDKLTRICYDKAYQMYGNPLPKIVKDRLEKELNSIIKHGFAVVYYISSQLVEKSLADGYLVGSRGSVGSSLVATLANITEVNPLVAHYYCPECQHSEFFEDGSVASGYDLPDKACPKCGAKMKGDGQDIPFETFLGFEGDKVPDIDLNFSSEYQSKAHDYTKQLFGEDYVYRAGTISTVAAKTAYGYAKGYHEKKGTLELVKSTELERLSLGSEGVKRTTGQHPGGIIVIPDYMDIYDFSPINFPADDLKSNWKTTHFDFHAIHDNVLKLDILGHVDPTAIRMLQDLTNVDPKTIPTNDAKVMSLFSSNDALGISDKVNYKNAAIGIPEFGTQFVRHMLDDTKPKTFAELVQISGLSHGTDVWVNNAQSLVKRGVADLKSVIGCRDDIMVYLMYRGLEPKLAFTIMESVRKGKGLNDEWIDIMKKNEVPQWYIDSCNKITYMFPKAHAAAYVLMAIRLAYFKVYYPLEYYATFFTTRCTYYEVETLIKGADAIKARLEQLQALGNDASAKEKDLIITLELAYEMVLRGYQILPIDIDKSQAMQFVVDHDKKAVIPPFIAIDGLGVNVGQDIIKARQKQPFISKEDLTKRTSLNYNHVLFLEKIGALTHLQELNQLSLF